MARVSQKPKGIIVYDNQGNEAVNYPSEMVESIKNTVAKDATVSELMMFLTVANRYDLDPFLKEVWFIKSKDGKCSVQTGVAGYRQIAKRDSRFKVCHVEVVFEEDDFKITRSMGEITNIEHSYTPSERGNRPIGAYAVLKTKDDDVLFEYVSFEEYYTGVGAWENYKSEMIKKVAESNIYKRFCNIHGLDSYEAMPKEFTENMNELDLNESEVIDVNIKGDD